MNYTNDNIYQLEITGITADGNGVGRWDHMAIFVPETLPGEVVQARIYQRKKRYALARAEKILLAHPQRKQPECPVYAQCGGCTFGHVSYDTELKLKQMIVQQALNRIGGINIQVPMPLAAPKPEHYRNRCVLHYQQGKLGFYQQQSHSICEMPSCLLLREPLIALFHTLQQLLPSYQEQLHTLREIVIRTNSAGDRLLLTFVATARIEIPEALLLALSQIPHMSGIWLNSGKAVYSIYGRDWQLLWGDACLSERLGEVKLKLAPAAFLQVNPEQTLTLYKKAAEFAQLQGSEVVWDLYSGVGSIALSICHQAAFVTGVESYQPSVTSATENQKLNGIENCRFICGEAENILPELAKEQHPDVIFVDPPRAGLHPRAIASMLQVAPEKIVYISCDPATLSRDLAVFCSDRYRLEAIQPVDMFPGTKHVETVVLMSRV